MQQQYFRKITPENYKNRIGIDIQNDHIFTSSGSSEAKISTNEIKEIAELKDIIVIRLDVTKTFVIPKDQVKDLPALISELKDLAKKVKVNYSEELNWVWK